MGSEGPEEEELWLYGGSPACDEEDGATSGRYGQSSDTQQNVSTESQDDKALSLQVTQSCSDDEDSDTDSDEDDVKVTIGDIRTGAPSCMGSAGTVKANRGYGVSVGKLPQRGIDFSAPGCINGVPVLEVDLDSFEDKPWRKPGADISDYFNYGFNEATWKVYCEKQRRLQMGLENGHQTSSQENRITVQQGRIGYTAKRGENSSVNTDPKHNISASGHERTPSEISENSKFGGTIDVIGGMVCSITRVEGRRWDSHDSEDISIQILGDHGYNTHNILQHQQPPPPLLPPPTIAPNPSPFSGLPPPPFPPHFFQKPPPTAQVPPSLRPPALLPPPLVSTTSVRIPPLNGPQITYTRPPPHHSYSSMEPCVYPPVSTAHTPWVTTVNKGTSSFSEGSEWTPRRQQERETERPRNQTFNNYMNDGDRYLNYHRDRSYEHERKYLRSDERIREQSWEKEERPRAEDSQRDRENTSKHKSSRRKQNSEERDSHRRHKRKKSKRSKEEKSSCEDGSLGATRQNHRE
ncbi:pre-mRNA 3'-end-processing factor FIP1-like [Spea bombifrons]|uniref:pre-mRNA 3'-end-processing factor FIP1-like n=1 Tax=Spea bombifrons TaxID=233779 RepID=UPI00234BE227|nr:pre-mRNA 3'-end-processing factor FIP1-like [Spea bombifrons]